MEDSGIRQMIDSLARRRGEYSPEAYFFTLEALNLAAARLPVRRHLSGPELLRGIVFLAWQRFGESAALILDDWGVCRTRDFGVIVLDLVEEGILSKTEDDSLEDFENVFDLREAIREEGWRQRWRHEGSNEIFRRPGMRTDD